MEHDTASLKRHPQRLASFLQTVKWNRERKSRAQPHFDTPEADGQVEKGRLSEVGRALKHLGGAHPSLSARGARAQRADVRHPAGPADQGNGASTDGTGGVKHGGGGSALLLTSTRSPSLAFDPQQ
jgi:hypothetical protein